MATSAPADTDLGLLLSRAAHGLHTELTELGIAEPPETERQEAVAGEPAFSEA